MKLSASPEHNKRYFSNDKNDSLSLNLFIITAICFCLFILVFIVRPLLPVDEARYVSVAWNMWRQHQWLVPYLNNGIYTQKPPLLFWLLNLGWYLFGVNDWWPRLLPTLSGLGVLGLVAAIANYLWPQEKRLQILTPFILLGIVYWTANLSILRFDITLSFFVLLAVYALLRLVQQPTNRWWGLFSLAIVAGLLTKGPVVLVFTLVPWLLIPFFFDLPKTPRVRWYSSGAICIVLAAIPVLTWVLSIVDHVGVNYGYQLLWKQSAGRMFASFAHAKPIWGYLPSLAVLFFPWVLWLPAWRNLKLCWTKSEDKSLNFCFYSFLMCLVIMSLISGKRIFYLFPLIPFYALIIARLIILSPIKKGDHWLLTSVLGLLGALVLIVNLEYIPIIKLLNHQLNLRLSFGLTLIFLSIFSYYSAKVFTLENQVKAVSVVGIIMVVLYHLLITPAFVNHKYPDAKLIALQLAAQQQQQISIAILGAYEGNYDFLGKLQYPLDVINANQIAAWRKLHPHGIIYTKRNNKLQLT